MGLIVLVGVAGSGKSTFTRRLAQMFSEIEVVSTDGIRREITGSEEHVPGLDAKVHVMARQRVAAVLRSGGWALIDATNLVPQQRRPYLQMASRYGHPSYALAFDLPLELVLAQNSSRQRVVPEAVIREMYSQRILPTVAEGFTGVFTFKCHSQSQALLSRLVSLTQVAAGRSQT